LPPDWTKAPSHLDVLPKVRLLILGPYRGGGASKLKRIRSSLITKGISNCRLVLDFRSPPEQPEDMTYDLAKSEYWIRRADILLFIFLGNTDNTGVAYELAYANRVLRRASDSIVAYYETNSASTSRLIKQHVIRYSREITEIRFDNDDILIEKSYGQIIPKLDILYHKLSRRRFGEWEKSSFISGSPTLT